MLKPLDTKTFLSHAREWVEEGKQVRLMISGSSMSPFLIHARDCITFSKPARALRKGDMVFYQRDTGEYVMHRICRVEQDAYYLIGDAQTVVEGPIRREQIFALVTQALRKGQTIAPGDFWWEFFARVWPNIIPLRRAIISIYRFFLR